MSTASSQRLAAQLQVGILTRLNAQGQIKAQEFTLPVQLTPSEFRSAQALAAQPAAHPPDHVNFLFGVLEEDWVDYRLGSQVPDSEFGHRFQVLGVQPAN